MNGIRSIFGEFVFNLLMDGVGILGAFAIGVLIGLAIIMPIFIWINRVHVKAERTTMQDGWRVGAWSGGNMVWSLYFWDEDEHPDLRERILFAKQQGLLYAQQHKSKIKALKKKHKAFGKTI
jgi:hypothetical protein